MNRTLLLFASAGALVVLAVLAAPTSPTAPKPAPSVTAAAPAPQAAPTALAQHGVLTLDARMASAYAANAGAPNYLTIQVRAAEDEQHKERVPVNMVVAIDRSGSMSGEKFTQAKEAARALVAQLRDTDRLAIVSYGSDVTTFPSQLATPEAKRQMLTHINRLVDGGGTFISGALQEARTEARRFTSDYRANRIILLSDGQPTEGETTEEGLRGVVDEIRESGVTLSAMGVGRDYDEVLMHAMAEAGGGFTGYISDARKLAEVFGRELDRASRMVARDAELSVELPDGVRVEEVLGRAVTWQGNVAHVRLCDFNGGLSTRVVMRVSVAYDKGAAPVHLGKVSLSYRDLTRDALVTTAQNVGGTVTDDPKLALLNADKQLIDDAMRAEHAKQLAEAAVHFRNGDKEGGMKVLEGGLDNLRTLFGSSANALAGSVDELRNENDLRRATLTVTKRNLANFGDNLDSY